MAISLSRAEATSAISRALFRAVIPTYLRQGLSANAMILDFRGYGLGYRRSAMLQDIRQFQGFFVGEARQKSISRTNPVPLSVTPSHDYGAKPDYRVYGYANWEHPETGEVRSTPVSFFTDQHLSPEQYEDFMGVEMEISDSEPGWNFLNADFRMIERNA